MVFFSDQIQLLNTIDFPLIVKPHCLLSVVSSRIFFSLLNINWIKRLQISNDKIVHVHVTFVESNITFSLLLSSSNFACISIKPKSRGSQKTHQIVLIQNVVLLVFHSMPLPKYLITYSSFFISFSEKIQIHQYPMAKGKSLIE